ncbi:hypothetical protein ACFLX5_02980 [Chloroflexota bacterium]
MAKARRPSRPSGTLFEHILKQRYADDPELLALYLKRLKVKDWAGQYGEMERDYWLDSPAGNQEALRKPVRKRTVDR